MKQGQYNTNKPAVMSSQYVSSVDKEEFALLFPTFLRAYSPESIRQFQPKDMMSPLAAAVGLLLRNRCSTSESEISPERAGIESKDDGHALVFWSIS